MKTNIKISYIGGGSRGWGPQLISDLLLQDNFGGEVRLYDINKECAMRNEIIGNRAAKSSEAKSQWYFSVSETLEDSLAGADFVLISILPGTLDEMWSDVHAPERYDIYQSVGDTVGPGGIIRAMRSLPIFEKIGKAVKKICPEAVVINFTNPMTLCVRALYGVFPKIKAFGCCHEVFGSADFMAKVVMSETEVKNLTRRDINHDVCGVNHFTWFTKAEYKGQDITPLYEKYISGNFAYYKKVDNCFYCSETVKMDLFRRYGQIAASGDRHLAEFLCGSWYLKNPDTVHKYGFALTTVAQRKINEKEMLDRQIAWADGSLEFRPKKSNEEGVELMSALLGFGDFVSNVNLPNSGQMQLMPKNAIVETNALFSEGKITPIGGKPLNRYVNGIVYGIIRQQENLFDAITRRNFDDVFKVFVSDPLCCRISHGDARKLFDLMVESTRNFLREW